MDEFVYQLMSHRTKRVTICNRSFQKSYKRDEAGSFSADNLGDSTEGIRNERRSNIDPKEEPKE
jgi:hypothetical protein